MNHQQRKKVAKETLKDPTSPTVKEVKVEAKEKASSTGSTTKTLLTSRMKMMHGMIMKMKKNATGMMPRNKSTEKKELKKTMKPYNKHCNKQSTKSMQRLLLKKKKRH